MKYLGIATAILLLIVLGPRIAPENAQAQTLTRPTTMGAQVSKRTIHGWPQKTLDNILIDDLEEPQ
jgi:hypothetical protein